MVNVTREEALSMIIDALDNVEEFDDALSVLRTDTGSEEAATWKAKYNELSEKYKARFKEEIMNQPAQALEKPDEKPIVPAAAPKLDSLDFSGATE